MQKLLTVEILCFGVPSPLIWNDYILYLEKNYGELKNYCFRDERDGWSTSYIHCATFEGGKELYRTKETQAFGSLFSSHFNIRPSCFECSFSSMERCADITIGDCWGVEHIRNDFADAYGVSQVLINTDKGMDAWNAIKENLDWQEADINEVALYNSVIVHPALKPQEYNLFWKDYNRFGLKKCMKKYTRLGLSYRIRRKLRRILQRITCLLLVK